MGLKSIPRDFIKEKKYNNVNEEPFDYLNLVWKKVGTYMTGLSKWRAFYKKTPWWRIEEICEMLDNDIRNPDAVITVNDISTQRAIVRALGGKSN